MSIVKIEVSFDNKFNKFSISKKIYNKFNRSKKIKVHERSLILHDFFVHN